MVYLCPRITVFVGKLFLLFNENEHIDKMGVRTFIDGTLYKPYGLIVRGMYQYPFTLINRLLLFFFTILLGTYNLP